MGMLVVALLIWGPIYHDSPAWLALRIGYLVAIPIFAFFVLHVIWNIWRPDEVAEDRLRRTLAGLTAGLFLVFAYFKGVAKSHVDNTHWIQTQDGVEAVGNDVTFPGPDWNLVIMFLLLSGLSFWISVKKPEVNEDSSRVLIEREDSGKSGAFFQQIAKVGLIVLSIFIIHLILPLLGAGLIYLISFVADAFKNLTGVSSSVAFFCVIGGFILMNGLREYFSDSEKFPRIANSKQRLYWRAEDFWWKIRFRFRRK